MHPYLFFGNAQTQYLSKRHRTQQISESVRLRSSGLLDQGGQRLATCCTCNPGIGFGDKRTGLWKNSKKSWYAKLTVDAAIWKWILEPIILVPIPIIQILNSWKLLESFQVCLNFNWRGSSETHSTSPVIWASRLRASDCWYCRCFLPAPHQVAMWSHPQCRHLCSRKLQWNQWGLRLGAGCTFRTIFSRRSPYLTNRCHSLSQGFHTMLWGRLAGAWKIR